MDSYKYVGFARQQSFNYFLGQKSYIFRELRKKRERVQKKRA